MRAMQCFLLSLAFVTAVSAAAQDVGALLDGAKKYAAEKNFPKALEQLGLARVELEKLNSEGLGRFLPDELAGLTGEKAVSNAAAGITNISRSYGKDGQSLKVSLLAGRELEKLSRMALVMGADPKAFRIQGRTGHLDEKAGATQLTVFMNSGAVLQLKSDKAEQADLLRKAVAGLDLDKIDQYLQGR
jgi:hypothetical protein